MLKKPQLKSVYREACYDGTDCYILLSYYLNHFAKLNILFLSSSSSCCYSYLKGHQVGKIGRKRLISSEGLASLAEELTKDSVNLEADTRPKFKSRCQHAIAKQNNWNSLVPVDTIPLSEKTIDRYIKLGFVERQAQVKNTARSEAYINIRNSIACASVLTSVENVVDLENFHSSDDVGFLLNGMNQKKVLISLFVESCKITAFIFS